MSNVQKLTELLTGKFFTYKGKEQRFESCRDIYGKILILTTRDTIQVMESEVEVFIEAIKGTISNKAKAKRLPVAKPVSGIVVPGGTTIFETLNEKFDNLLTEYENITSEKDLDLVLNKSKILTSVAQSAVNMQNSNLRAYELINRNLR